MTTQAELERKALTVLGRLEHIDRTVRATGTSEGAKKGWEHRAHHDAFLSSSEDEHPFMGELPGGGFIRSSGTRSRGTELHSFHLKGDPSPYAEVRRDKAAYGKPGHEVKVSWPSKGSSSAEHARQVHEIQGHAIALAEHIGSRQY